MAGNVPLGAARRKPERDGQSNEGERGYMMDDIEITPEMIEAGALALSEHHIEYESREEAVIRV